MSQSNKNKNNKPIKKSDKKSDNKSPSLVERWAADNGGFTVNKKSSKKK